MINDFKQSCSKFNLDFNKSYTGLEFINDFGSICRFCNNELKHNSLDLNYYCLKCYYLIRLIHLGNGSYRLYDVTYKYIYHVCTTVDNDYIIIRCPNLIVPAPSADFQTIINKINTLHMCKCYNDSKL